MKCSYLNSYNQILASHTAEEMKKMLNEELIRNDTSIVRAGDDSSGKVSKHSLDSKNEICSTWNKNDCVSIKRGERVSLAHTLMNNIFVLEGRSSRKEFWISFSFLGAISVYFSVLPGLLIQCSDFVAVQYNFGVKFFLSADKFAAVFPDDIFLNLYLIFLMFFGLLVFTFLFILSVRRFRDMGYTLLFPLLAYIVIPFLCACVAPAFFDISIALLLILSTIFYIPRFVVLGVCLFGAGDNVKNEYGTMLI